MDTGQKIKYAPGPVLVIEDDADIRTFVMRVLELDGYEVLEAGDGTTGMEIVRQSPVGLVLLDLRLPGTDGWSILREIKHDPELSEIPVIVLTALAENLQRRRTLRMGVTSYLIKPLSAHSLSRAVAKILQKRDY